MNKNEYQSWFFQAVPDSYDINRYLSECEDPKDYIYFRISNKYKNFIQKNHDVFIWRANSARKEFSRGIIAHGIIKEINFKDKVKYPHALRDDLWKEGSMIDSEGLVAGIQLDKISLNEDIITDEILKHEVFNNYSRVWQGTNFPLNEEQTNIIFYAWSMNKNSLASIIEDSNDISKPEGKIRYAVHRSKERNLSLRNKAVKRFQNKHEGKLFCELCNFSFEDIYGSLGKGFIEVHHIIPVSEMKKNHETKIDELMMLCANCHRMAHRAGDTKNLEIKKSRC